MQLAFDLIADAIASVNPWLRAGAGVVAVACTAPWLWRWLR